MKAKLIWFGVMTNEFGVEHDACITGTALIGGITADRFLAFSLFEKSDHLFTASRARQSLCRLHGRRRV